MVATCGNVRMGHMRSEIILRHGQTCDLRAYIPRSRGILSQQHSTRRQLRYDKANTDRALVRTAAREMSIVATAGPVAKRVVTLHVLAVSKDSHMQLAKQSLSQADMTWVHI